MYLILNSDNGKWSVILVSSGGTFIGAINVLLEKDYLYIYARLDVFRISLMQSVNSHNVKVQWIVNLEYLWPMYVE